MESKEALRELNVEQLKVSCKGYEKIIKEYKIETEKLQSEICKNQSEITLKDKIIEDLQENIASLKEEKELTEKELVDKVATYKLTVDGLISRCNELLEEKENE